MSKEQWTTSNRDTVVSACQIYKTNLGDFFHPTKEMAQAANLSPEDIAGEIWHVDLEFVTGMDQSSQCFFLYASQEAAEKTHNDYPVGSIMPQGTGSMPLRLQELYARTGSLEGLFSADEDSSFDCMQALIEAEVVNKYGVLSQKVLDWLGDNKISWMKEKFGDNWMITAEMEYCSNHFPSTSLAYLAAQISFNTYITMDDFSAGYLFREFQLIVGGAEQVVNDINQVRANAGKGGSKASSNAKRSRISQFMVEIENLEDLAGRMSEQAIVDQAFENAQKSAPKFWHQGRGQQSEYEVTLRSEEPFKSKYEAIFRKTA